MKRVAELIFEGCFLKQVPRSGYQFLGAGKESVAEHVFSTIFIAFIMAQLEPAADAGKLMAMCLVHDLPEARIGDLNYVQKKYLAANEALALSHSLEDLSFGHTIEDLLEEFNTGTTLEACLARDADQLALVADLKALQGVGYTTPQTWLPHVKARLKTEIGKQLAESLSDLPHDEWWRKLFS
jgi:putative hydrolase of HD superfamily